MTRLPIPLPPPPAPHSVILAELAIAAGIAGHSIAICYQGYPAPLLCGIWRHFASLVGLDRAFQVSNQADIRKLVGRIPELRLGLVHGPRLLNPTAWTIQMTDPATESVSRPAVFCRFTPTDPDDDPGATIVLRANSQECTLTQQWLMMGHLGCLGLADIEPSENNGVVPELPPVLSTALSTNGIGLRGSRDRQVLLGLLAGACLLRCVHQEDLSNIPLTVSLQDYALVRGILQSPILSSADEGFDPLAADMVSRANLYTIVKYGADRDGLSPFPADGPDGRFDIRGDRPPRELITRRELADLGNLRSRAVRRLVEYLQQRPDGYERFGRMGLVRHPPRRDDWARASRGSLTSRLRPWSVKQVRTHFDQLRRAGLVTAERDQANGPWHYRLPEELAGSSSIFRRLPTAEALEVAAGGQR
ncbi:MAG: hypothetical protein ACLQNE_42885 [Thermoguttaceae bacterium]